MISVSNDFKNAMKAPVKVVGAQIAIQDGATYTSGGDLVKAEVQSSGYFFGVATKTLTFTLLGTSYSLMEKLVNATLKVQTDASNDTWESCDLGAFQIVEQKIDLEKGMSNFKAYDAVGIAGLKPYAAGGLNFPCTVDNLAVQVASATNMSYDEGSLVNGTYTITEDLYSNISNLTFRDILAEVAGASASLASVSGVGSSLSFRSPSKTPLETLTYSNLKTYKLEPYYGDVNAVVLARTPQEDNVVAYPHEVASGTDITLPDAGESLKELKNVYGNTDQRCVEGKNLFALQYTRTQSGVTLTVNDDGTVNVHGTNSSKGELLISYTYIENELLDQDATYTLSASKALPAGLSARCENYNNRAWLNNLGLTINSGAQSATANKIAIGAGDRIRCAITVAGSATVNIDNVGFQLEKSASATAFEAFKGASARVQSRPAVVSGLNYIRVNQGKNLAEIKDGEYTTDPSGAGGAHQTWSIVNGVVTTTRTSTDYEGGMIDFSTGRVGRWSNGFDHRLTTNGGKYKLTVRKSGTITANNGYTRIVVAIFKEGANAMSPSRSPYLTVSADVSSLDISLANDEHVGSIIQYTNKASFTDLELRIQLEAGTSSTDFTPYVGKRHELLLTTGKNLFDATRIRGSNPLDTTMQDVQNGLTCKVSADGTISVTGTASASVQFYIPFNIPQSLVGKTATFSVSGTWGNLSDVGIKTGSDGIGLTLSGVGSSTVTVTQFMADSTSNLGIWIASGRTVSAKIKVQFEEGNGTAWERFQSLELAEVGDSMDKIYPSGSDWYIRKETGKYFLTGASTENWYLSTNALKCNNLSQASGSFASLGYPEQSTNYNYSGWSHDKLYCNYGLLENARYVVETQTRGNVGLGVVNTGGGNTSIYCSKEGYTVASWMARLADYPLVCYYSVQTPTDTKITNARIISELNAIRSAGLYGAGSRISIEPSNAMPTIDIDYWLSKNNLKEVKLANNEILDDDREHLADPILSAAKGFGFSPFTATTEGHGWHEVGDTILLGEGTPSGLPEGYQRVEYIESSGTQHINLGITGDSTLTMKGRIKTPSDLSTFRCIAGCTNNAAVRCFLAAQSGTTWSFGANNYQNVGAISANTDYDLDLNFGSAAYFKANGQRISAISNSSYSSGSSVRLFARGTQSGGVDNISTYRLYYWKIWKNGIIVRSLVPCYRKSDGAAGVYDMANGVFYGNAGTGNFTIGKEILDIPSEYQEVQYIQKTTTSMGDLIRTGIVPDTTTEAEIDFSVDELGVYNGVMGAAKTDDGGMSIRLQYVPEGGTYDLTDTTMYIRNLSTTSYDVAHVNLTKRTTVGMKSDGIYINGEKVSTSRGTYTSPADFMLFSVNRSNTGGSNYSSAWANTKEKIYSAKFWQGGSLVRHLVPCVRLSDNEPGFYDLVDGGFYIRNNPYLNGLVAGEPAYSRAVITDIKLTIDGGIKEELKGVAPDDTTTNYALAGGIKKSIYNTEIKVDKQGQEITSIVSRQDEFEGQTLANFSQISQNISSVVTTIQTTGGGNLIHNSVGYKKNTDGTLASWANVGTVASETSPESISYGALSGNQIDLGASSYITQEIPVDLTGSVYTLTFRAKKGATGIAKVSFYPKSTSSPSTDGFSVEMPNGEAVLWQEYTISSMKPVDTPMVIKVETNGSVTDFAITDLMLTVGDSRTPWVSASDEIMSKSVAIDSEGVKVSSNSNNDYVKLDELGLNGYSDAGGSLQNVFTVNRDLTEVAKLKSRQQIEMPPLKIVPINSSSNSGWGWVKI
jgi:hypothetical protein